MSLLTDAIDFLDKVLPEEEGDNDAIEAEVITSKELYIDSMERLASMVEKLAFEKPEFKSDLDSIRANIASLKK